MPAVAAIPMHRNRWYDIKCKRVETKSFDPFYVSSHAVAPRLACLTVTRPFVNSKVTPPPE
jgi:hypothetical protein